MSTSKQHFHLRSSSWDGGGGSTVGEEADVGVEGDRLQDIFCKLFQVRKCLKTLATASQVSDCIQFSCILRGGSLFLFVLLNMQWCLQSETRFDYLKDNFTTWDYFVILLPIFIVMLLISRTTSQHGTTLWWASMAWSWSSLSSAMALSSASSFAQGEHYPFFAKYLCCTW